MQLGIETTAGGNQDGYSEDGNLLHLPTTVRSCKALLILLMLLIGEEARAGGGNRVGR